MRKPVNLKRIRTAVEEGSMEPIREVVLERMRRDLRNLDEIVPEEGYPFQAGMVLLASEVVGPYVDRVAAFLGYSHGLEQVIADRLQEARIWEGDEVRCENWCDPQKGRMPLLLDVMVAEGRLVRRWSEDKNQYTYHVADSMESSQLVTTIG
jgi:hypothetical protein